MRVTSVTNSYLRHPEGYQHGEDICEVLFDKTLEIGTFAWHSSLEPSMPGMTHNFDFSFCFYR
jgi:hypothetical protein